MNTLFVYVTSAILLLFGAYIIFRVFVRRDYLRKGGVSLFTLLIELLICGLYCNFPYIYIPFRWPALPTLPENIYLRVPGLLLVTVGLTITLIGIFSLGFRRFLGLESKALDRTFPYSASRNPQIVGFFLYTLGFAVLWPSWYAVGWVALFLPIFHLMVITEEEYLLQMHGEAYQQYKDRVPRYLIF